MIKKEEVGASGDAFPLIYFHKVAVKTSSLLKDKETSIDTTN